MTLTKKVGLIGKYYTFQLQECLSLHKLLDTFPNMIEVQNKG